VLGITDEAWDPAIGPTETEILRVIGDRGWRLLQVDAGAHHPTLPNKVEVDRLTTYWFVR